MNGNITATVLEQRLMTSTAAFDRTTIHSFMVDAGDFMQNELRAALDAYVWSHKAELQTQTVTVKVPATWWQHFKYDAIKWGNPFFNPANVRMRQIELVTQYQVWETYPDLVLSPTKNGRVMFLDFDITNTLRE